MAYTVVNFRTKKQFKEFFKAATSAIPPVPVFVYQPNADITGHHFHDKEIVSIEGPHFPQAHTWYARIRIRSVENDGRVKFCVDAILA